MWIQQCFLPAQVFLLILASFLSVSCMIFWNKGSDVYLIMPAWHFDQTCICFDVILLFVSFLEPICICGNLGLFCLLWNGVYFCLLSSIFWVTVVDDDDDSFVAYFA